MGTRRAGQSRATRNRSRCTPIPRLLLHRPRHAYIVIEVDGVGIMYVFCFRWKQLVGFEQDAAVTMQPQRRDCETQLTQSDRDILSQPHSIADTAETTDTMMLFDDDDEAVGRLTGLSSPLMEWFKVRGGFQRILFSRLSPLKICSRVVVSEFDALANELVCPLYLLFMW